MTDAQQPWQELQPDGPPATLEALVQQNFALVYSSALRQVRDRHLAEDVTQAVFLIFARKAHSIASNQAVAGWLLTVTRRASIDALRKQAAERRRQIAVARPEAVDDCREEECNEITAVLDAAMNDLLRRDRDALVLRYFENRSLAEVGRAMQLTEEAARKRVNRALVRLRDVLKHYGIESGSQALGSILLTQAVLPLPAGNTVATALAPASANSSSIAQGVLRMMARTKTTLLSAMTCGILLLGGAGVWLFTLAAAQEKPATTLQTAVRSNPQVGIPIDPATTRPDPSGAHFRYAGKVVDEEGKPISKVLVIATYQLANGGYGESVSSRPAQPAGLTSTGRSAPLV